MTTLINQTLRAERERDSQLKKAFLFKILLVLVGIRIIDIVSNMGFFIDAAYDYEKYAKLILGTFLIMTIRQEWSS